MVARLVSNSITAGPPGRSVVTAYSYREAERVLAGAHEIVEAAVVDLELPDAPGGEIVDLLLEAGIPTIVLTGTYDEPTRQRILAKNVVDYFVKGDASLKAVNETLHRLQVNPGIPILVVDDSATLRLLTRKMLETHRFRVLEAADGNEALQRLEENPRVPLVITDYEMPNMDGMELLKAIRKKFERDEMAVIGVSALGDETLPARYLKFGADDFLTKPYQKEEFYCRVYRSIVNIEQIREIKRIAYTDQLTGLNNRLYFFQTAPDLFEEAIARQAPITVAMVDIDHFKQINDTHGHAGGDAALQHLSEILTEQLSSINLVARFGGEEFCALAVDLPAEDAPGTFEQLRRKVEGSSITFEGQRIAFTLSIGLTSCPRQPLDAFINRADEMLYEAKRSGRNRIVVDPDA
jgi:diguanylate cyclase (GGDEF)-like protein